MSRFRHCILALMASCLASCGHTPIKGEVASEQQPLFTAKIWIQDDPGLPAQLVLDGCAVWGKLGIECVRVKDPAQAHVRFEAHRRPCVTDPKSKDQLRTLATAHDDRHVEMYVNCLVGAGGKPDATQIKMVSAHELGHELGIWDHVPLDCDEREKRYLILEDGEKLCGEAVMNPLYDQDVDELTEMDGHAFAARRTDYSIYDPVSTVRHDHDGPTCTYVKKTDH